MELLFLHAVELGMVAEEPHGFTGIPEQALLRVTLQMNLLRTSCPPVLGVSRAKEFVEAKPSFFLDFGQLRWSKMSYSSSSSLTRVCLFAVALSSASATQ